MKKLKVTLLVFSVALFVGGVYGVSDSTTQSVTMTVAEIALIDVTGNPAALNISAPVTGGQTPSNATDSSTYAQYTSTVGAAVTRAITAAWGATDSAPAGCSLLLTATPSGGANEGSTAGQITVSDTPQNIATSIGSCATGTGGTDGAQLAYELSVTAMTSLVAGDSETATITLTLTDAS